MVGSRRPVYVQSLGGRGREDRVRLLYLRRVAVRDLSPKWGSYHGDKHDQVNETHHRLWVGTSEYF
jgi:hypothetical protein